MVGFLGGDDPIQRIEVAKNLIIASVMAAPGAIVISKLMFPQTEEVTLNHAVDFNENEPQICSNYSQMGLNRGHGHRGSERDQSHRRPGLHQHHQTHC